MKYRTLPLGIDLGSTRVRIACGVLDRENGFRLQAVSSRKLPDIDGSDADAPQLIAAVLDELLEELGTRERRCILAVRTPDAQMRNVEFPPMNAFERARAARFEARRFAGWDIDAAPTAVRVHPVDANSGWYTVGAVQRAVLDKLVKPAKMAGLRVHAIDDEGFALRRAFPEIDGIIDVGFERSALHASSPRGPVSWHVGVGSADITRGIATDLAIDLPAAEKRKCILGSAGAGIAACRFVVSELCAAIARARSRVPLERVALTGNGARLPGFQSLLAGASPATIEMPVSNHLICDAYPEDVVRSAGPDWSLAVGLCAWGAPS